MYIFRGYPGWEPNINSKTLKEVKNSYIKLFSSEPKVNVIHAGLECGIALKDFGDFQKKDIIEVYNSTITERTI